MVKNRFSYFFNSCKRLSLLSETPKIDTEARRDKGCRVYFCTSQKNLAPQKD